MKDLRRKVLQLQESEAKQERERTKEIADVFTSSGVLRQELATSLLRDVVRVQQISIAHAQSALSSYVVRAIAVTLV